MSLHSSKRLETEKTVFVCSSSRKAYNCLAGGTKGARGEASEARIPHDGMSSSAESCSPARSQASDSAADDSGVTAGSLQSIHAVRQLAEQAQKSASPSFGHTQSQRPYDVTIHNKGRFQMLTFKVRWRRRKMRWSTSYFGIGNAYHESAVIILELHEHHVLSMDVRDISDVLRMSHPRRLRFYSKAPPPSNRRRRVMRQHKERTRYLLEFATDAECNEAFVALISNRNHLAPERVKLQLVRATRIPLGFMDSTMLVSNTGVHRKLQPCCITRKMAPFFSSAGFQ